VILVTRLNGDGFALNPDLVERADATPDTVVTLVDGTKYLISESVAELVELVRDYRASVIAAAGALDDARRADAGAHSLPGTHPVARATTTQGEHPGAVVALHRRDHR
jgi:flagellar protein FlbD